MPEMVSRDRVAPDRLWIPIRRFAKLFLHWLVYDGYAITTKRYKCLLDWYEHYALQPVYGDAPPIEKGVPFRTDSSGHRWVIFPGVDEDLGPWRFLLPTYGPFCPKKRGGTRWHRHVCYQLRITKRALPEPSRDMYVESARKLRSVVTTYVDYPIKLQQVARQFASRLSSKLKPSPSRAPEHTVISESACLEYAKSDRGNKGWFLEQLSILDSDDRFVPLESKDVWGREVYTPPALDVLGEMVLMREVYPSRCFFSGLDPSPTELAPYLIARAFEESGHLPKGSQLLPWEDQGLGSGPCDHIFFSEEPIPHRCRVCIVLDSGGKARAITVHSAPVVILLHFLRTHLYRKLASMKSITSLGGEGSGSRALISWTDQGQLEDDEYFLSIDFTQATDTFPVDLCRDLLYGFLEHFDGPMWLRRLVFFAARFACSPVVLDFSDYGLPEAVSERAIFMGTPTSWSLLNLMLMYLISCSDSLASVGIEAPTRFPSPDRQQLSTHTVRDAPPIELIANVLVELSKTDNPDPNAYYKFVELCGDDLVGRVSRALGHNFLYLAECLGLIPSTGTNALSKTSAVFTETLYSVRGRGLWWEDHIKPKSLVDSRSPARVPGTGNEIPCFVTRGIAASDTLSKLKKFSPDDKSARIHELSYKACCWFVMACNRDFIRTLRRFSLPVYLPRQFGGAGFPYYLGFEAAMKHERTFHRRMAGWLIRSDSSPEHATAMRSLAGIWNPWFRTDAGRECSRLMDEWFRRVLDPTREYQSLELTRFDYRTTPEGWAPCWIRFEKILDHYSRTLNISVAELKQQVFEAPERWRKRFKEEFDIIPLRDAAGQREGFFRKDTMLLDSLNVATDTFRLSAVAKEYARIARRHLTSVASSGFDIGSLSEVEVRRLMWWAGRQIFVRVHTSQV